MAVTRVCFVVVFFLCIHGIVGKPIFERVICDYFCDDDDDGSDSSSEEDFLDFLFGCTACTRKTVAPSTVAPMTTSVSAQAQNNVNPMSINIQPGSAITLTMSPGQQSLFTFTMSNGMLVPVSPAAVTTTVIPTAAGAPDATSAAPATTASASATTVAAPATTAAA